MDGAECGVICHLRCEISSVSVTGLGFGGGELLFLRCHVPAGGGRAIQIDSPATTAPVDGGVVSVSWRDVASLRCDGAPACVRELVEQRRSVVFEVRRRRRPAGIGRRAAALRLRRRILGLSELVGRAEVALRDTAGGGIDQDEAVVERRVALAAPGGGGRNVLGDEVPSPLLSVRMTVRVWETAAPAGGRRRAVADRESGWSVGDEALCGLAAWDAEGALE